MQDEIKTMDALIEDLSVCYVDVRKKKITMQDATVIANVANRLIKGVATQLQYNQYMKNGRKISFLETEKSQP